MNKKGVSFIVGFIIVVLIIIVIASCLVTLYIINKNKINEKIESKYDIQETVYKNITIIGNDYISKYRIISGRKIIAESILFPNNKEIFNKIENNKTYTIYAWDDNLYMDSIIFNSSFNEIIVDPKPIAGVTMLVAHTSGWEYDLRIHTFSGHLRKPLLCEKHSFNILNINISEGIITEDGVPEKLKAEYDSCFTLRNMNMSDTLDIIFNIIPFDEITEEDYVTFILVDKVKMFVSDYQFIDNYFYNGKDLGFPNMIKNIPIVT